MNAGTWCAACTTRSSSRGQKIQDGGMSSVEPFVLLQPDNYCERRSSRQHEPCERRTSKRAAPTATASVPQEIGGAPEAPGGGLRTVAMWRFDCGVPQSKMLNRRSWSAVTSLSDTTRALPLPARDKAGAAVGLKPLPPGCNTGGRTARRLPSGGESARARRRPTGRRPSRGQRPASRREMVRGTRRPSAPAPSV
eukprot:SAG11_NODE_12643_length_693_cov_0.840067_1_plen_194_part_01